MIEQLRIGDCGETERVGFCCWRWGTGFGEAGGGFGVLWWVWVGEAGVDGLVECED
jgi:hypothetical protein